jgi:hypothetical protein
MVYLKAVRNKDVATRHRRPSWEELDRENTRQECARGGKGNLGGF